MVVRWEASNVVPLQVEYGQGAHESFVIVKHNNVVDTQRLADVKGYRESGGTRGECYTTEFYWGKTGARKLIRGYMLLWWKSSQFEERKQKRRDGGDGQF